jgi:hypothetical protein
MDEKEPATAPFALSVESVVYQMTLIFVENIIRSRLRLTSDGAQDFGE